MSTVIEDLDGAGAEELLDDLAELLRWTPPEPRPVPVAGADGGAAARRVRRRAAKTRQKTRQVRPGR
jgi:hypothetical protein